MHPDQFAFIKALEENEDDDATRAIYSDWLEENNQPEEADRMRRWKASKEWMIEWVKSINYGEYEKDKDGNFQITEVKLLGYPHTLDDVIKNGHTVCAGGTMYWGTDEGANYFREADAKTITEWMHHWSTLTGTPVPTSVCEHMIEFLPFRCGC